MATNADIAACLGEGPAKYAANKHRGGSNGNKGTRYEDFFIAYKVVEAAVSLLTDPTAPNLHIKGQDDVGFVDDARIASDMATGYFQLKNKNSVSWMAGRHPIATDFGYQATLSKHIGEPTPSTNLVVPTAALAAELRESIPADIKDHTQVHHFPWSVTANRLILESANLRKWLAKLSHVDAPTDDVLSGAFGMFLMANLECPDGATVSELTDLATKMFPGQLRLLPITEDWEQRLTPAFTQVLAGIPGLKYSAKRGFFCWSGFGTSGVFGSSVLSEEFKNFENNIVQIGPKTFEEFEEVLS